MTQDRNQPRYPSDHRDVRRPRQDPDSERYQGRGDGERSDEAREVEPRYGDRREYSYGDDFGSERSYGSRYGAQRGGREDSERSERSGSSYQSYDSDDDRGRQHEGSGPRYSYGAPGQGFGQSQGSSWGGSFGGSVGSYGATGRGYGGRKYYGGQGQSQGQTQYGGQESSQRSGNGDSWGSTQRENRGYGSQQNRGGDGEGAYGDSFSYRKSSQPYSYQGGSGMLISESSSYSTAYGPYTGKGPKNYKRSDQQIVEEANQALERHGEVDASEIEVTCENGVLKLSGKVENRRAKREAEECVERIYGVHDVMNELKVDKGFFASLFGLGSSSSSSTSSSSTPSASAGTESSDDRSSSRSPSSKPFQKNT